MESTNLDVRKNYVNFVIKSSAGIHGLRIHLAFEKKKASSLKEVYQIREEIARVKRRYRAILNDYMRREQS